MFALFTDPPRQLNVVHKSMISTPEWSLSANFTTGYADDDWYFTGSWSGSRTVYPGVVYYITVFADNGGRKATRWTSEVKIHGVGYHVDSPHHSCKSKVDALRWADRALTADVLHGVFADFYSRNPTYCLSIKQGDEYVPWLSYLGANLPWRALPYGKYICASFHWGKPFYEQMSIGPGGYTGHGITQVAPYWSRDDKTN